MRLLTIVAALAALMMFSSTTVVQAGDLVIVAASTADHEAATAERHGLRTGEVNFVNDSGTRALVQATAIRRADQWRIHALQVDTRTPELDRATRARHESRLLGGTSG